MKYIILLILVSACSTNKVHTQYAQWDSMSYNDNQGYYCSTCINLTTGTK